MSNFSFIVPKEFDNKALRNFLRYKKVSARLIARLVRTEKGIMCGDKPIKTIDIVHYKDLITINIDEETNLINPTQGELDILFEDDYFLIVNKPPFMPVHPTKNYQTDTLANIVAYYQRNKGETCTFRAINRIDRNTSGIVVVAKNKYSAIVKDSITKVYTAVCQGKICSDGVIDEPIGLCDNSKIKRTVRNDGKNAVTKYYVREHSDNYTLLDIVLETGRTHQIRCHMSHLGFPLAGDDLYGGKTDRINRQALHCRSVSFVHPVTNRSVLIECPMPDDMAKLI